MLALASSVVPAVAAADDMQPGDADKVNMAVEADSPEVVIERRASTYETLQATLGIPIFNVTEQWVTVCAVPCSVTVDANSYYRVQGDGVAPSAHFTLPRPAHPGDPVSVKVDARSGFLHSLGIGMSIVGGVAAVVGGISTFYAPSITNTTVEASVRKVGVTILISGLVLLATGIPTWLATYSHVKTDAGGAK